MYENGKGVSQDETQAAYWYRRAAEQGHANAQNNLGVTYKEGKGVTQDGAQAVYWFRKAAEQGHAGAQTNLGVMYKNGKGVTQDDAQAVFWFRKAAEQGQAEGQTNLGVMYKNGKGVSQDDAQAVYWYRKAAEQGEVIAQTNLGAMYNNGTGVTQDYAQAVYWSRKAAEQGDKDAQLYLGVMYQRGEEGVTRDLTQAVYWFQLAAKQGNTVAQRELALAYAAGVGVPMDGAKALSWFEKAKDGVGGESGFCNQSEGKNQITKDSCWITVRDYGRALEVGIGGKADTAEAKRLYGLVNSKAAGLILDTPLWPGFESVKNRESAPEKAGSSLQAAQLQKGQACGVDGVASEIFHPQKSSGLGTDRELDVAVRIESAEKWPRSRVRRLLQGTADILAHCGIQLRAARLEEGPNCSYEIFNKTNAATLPIYISGKDDFNSFASGWYGRIELQARASSEDLAHEFGHLLGNLDHPATFEPNIMQYGVLLAALPRFTPAQCERLRASQYLLPASASLGASKPLTLEKPAELAGKSSDEVIRYLQSRNKYSALFYEIRPRHESSSLNSSPLSLYRLAKIYDLRFGEVIKMVEHAHNWRGEWGWVDERTRFDLISAPKIFGMKLTEIDLENARDEWFASKRQQVIEDLENKKDLLKADVPAKEGRTWLRASALNFENRLAAGPGAPMPVEPAKGSRVTSKARPGYEEWLRGGDLFQVAYSGDERRIVGVYRNFLNLWVGDNLDALRKAPNYDRAWENPAKNPKVSVSSDVQPTQSLRNDRFGAPTPASLPGASLITPLETWQVVLGGLAGRPGTQAPVVLSAIEHTVGLPTAYDMAFAAAGGSLEDEIQIRLGKVMGRLAPDKKRTVIVYCHHENCWLSYNLGLRLNALGYKNVRWLRAGLRDWVRIGLPMAKLMPVDETTL